jgi:site-specific DNA-methyltransferase (adenine-specific)
LVGQVSRVPEWKVSKTDCVTGLKKVEDSSIDFVFADPPYLLSNGGMTVSSGKQVLVNKGAWDTSNGFEADLEFHRNWISAVKPKLTPNGSIVISGTYHSIYKCGVALEELGFRILNEIIWFKPNGAPNIGARSFAASHETLIWASLNKKAKHTFNYLEMKHGNFPGDSLKNPGKQMRSVWSIPNTPQREKTFGRHPTQKPLALLERIILACTNPGELVLDPFVGSGTTGVAAVANGRNFLGFDIDGEFVTLAKERIKSALKRGQSD